jgi:Rod binding domain-containing protein
MIQPLSLARSPVEEVKELGRSGPSGRVTTGGAREESGAAQAAQQFEAVLVRMMLEPLQKTTQLSKSQLGSSGGGAYASMIVDALADALAASGGVGLAPLVEKALSPPGKGGG